MERKMMSENHFFLSAASVSNINLDGLMMPLTPLRISNLDA